MEHHDRQGVATFYAPDEPFALGVSASLIALPLAGATATPMQAREFADFAAQRLATFKQLEIVVSLGRACSRPTREHFSQQGRFGIVEPQAQTARDGFSKAIKLGSEAQAAVLASRAFHVSGGSVLLARRTTRSC